MIDEGQRIPQKPASEVSINYGESTKGNSRYTYRKEYNDTCPSCGISRSLHSALLYYEHDTCAEYCHRNNTHEYKMKTRHRSEKEFHAQR